MTSESAFAPPPSYHRIYVSWNEQWTLLRYVDHYLQERNVVPTDELRRAVARCIDNFPGKGSKKKADMDYYLDQNAKQFIGKRGTGPA